MYVNPIRPTIPGTERKLTPLTLAPIIPMETIHHDAFCPAIKNASLLSRSLPVTTHETIISTIKYAIRNMHDVVIIDTAGRLQIDEALMEELAEVKAEVNPAEILLVIDAMTGQEAANVAETFNAKLDVTGIILSKLDSDTRGGAALSVRAITGKPVKFASSGEKINDFEIFYPKRMADRILGMGDVLTLIDKAVEMYDEKQAEELEKKIMTQTFTLDDFLDQLQQIKKMGGIMSLLKLLPGAGQIKEEDIDERQLVKVEAIIRSMTKKEKRNPDILNASRRKRIAAGSGTTVQDVNKLMKQFEEMRVMMKKLGGKGKKGIGKKMLGGKMPNIFM